MRLPLVWDSHMENFKVKPARNIAAEMGHEAIGLLLGWHPDLPTLKHCDAMIGYTTRDAREILEEVELHRIRGCFNVHVSVKCTSRHGVLVPAQETVNKAAALGHDALRLLLALLPIGDPEVGATFFHCALEHGYVEMVCVVLAFYPELVCATDSVSFLSGNSTLMLCYAAAERPHIALRGGGATSAGGI